MKGEHKRIVELASGWEGSDAYVSLSPADAVLLESVGAPVEAGTHAAGPKRIKGTALFAAAEQIKAADVETPEGGEPTPNQQSVTGPGPAAPAAGGEAKQPGTADLGGPTNPNPFADDLDDQTVADLRETADAEGVDLPAGAKKADIVAAIRAARQGR